jgi:hypothetical protein
MKYKYRIEERILDDGKSEYVPQRCEIKPKLSLLDRLLGHANNENWQSIAGSQYLEYDRGYSTMKEAQSCINRDKDSRQPEVVAVMLHNEEQLHGIEHPYG